ncbi:MAG: hypothetical protein IPL53_13735 [Ignavibacteria bacterium]|nr:hypothetical protein [Ignavibacteria bacterium]
MFKHYFELIDGVEIYPVISLIIFTLFFVIIVIRAFTTDKKYIKEMEMLPLDNEQ